MTTASTMKALAEELGVSRTTVSLVLKGEGDRYRIARATQQRVLERVQRSGYKPNFFATGLTRGRTGIVGLVFPDLFEDFMVQGLRGIEDAFLGTDLLPIVCSSRFDPAREERQIEELLHRGVEGLLVAPTACFRGQPRSLSLFRRLQREGKPLVFLDRHPAALKQAVRVRQDDRLGGRLAAEALLARGCRRPAYIGFDLDITTLPERLAGFAEALGEAGCALPQYRRALLKEVNPAAQDLATLLAAWRRSARGPDGLFVATSGLAERCRILLSEQGVAAGRDMPLVRFGPSQRHAQGCIRGIRQPHRAMGRAAATLLGEWIASGHAPASRDVTLPVELDDEP